MKRRVLFFGLIVSLVALAPSAEAAKKKLLYGSTSPRSSFYTAAVSIAKAINLANPDTLNVTVVATGGGGDNLRRLIAGTIDFGQGTWPDFYQAYTATGKFKNKKPLKHLRLLWAYSVNAMNYVVRADSGVKSLSDLSGKTLNPGMRGSSTEALVQQILSIVKVKPKFFRAGLSDAVQAVKDNRIAGYVKAGAGLELDASTRELQAFVPIRVLGFTEAQKAAVQKKLPYLSFSKVPAGTVKGGPEYLTPVQVIGTMTTTKMSNETAYRMIKGVVENYDIQKKAFRGMVPDFAKASVQEALFPLHAGVVRYLKEKGLRVPAKAIGPEAK